MGDKGALVLFTLLAQAGIGLLTTAQFLGAAGDLGQDTCLWVVILTAGSMAVSLLHLGSPLGAYRTIYNVRSSWLSREILFLGTFFGLTLLRAYFSYEGTSGEAAVAFGWLAVAFGWLCLFSMAAIYVKTSIPAWGTMYTHLSFYTTAIILGPAAYAVIGVRLTGLPPDVLVKAFVATAVGAVLQLAGLAVYLPTLGAGEMATQASARLLSAMKPVMAVSQILTMLGGFLLTMLAFQAYAAGGETAAVPWAYGMLAAVAGGQLLNRYLFYASGVHLMQDRL